MKYKYCVLTFTIVLFVSLLSSCSKVEVNLPNQKEYIPENANTQLEEATDTITRKVDFSEELLNVDEKLVKESKIAVQIESPITIARSQVSTGGTYLDLYLSIQLVRGRYSEDWTPGAFEGRNWNGVFVFVLSNRSGEIISETTVNSFYDNAPLTFNSFFDFHFDDYNNDGNIDFIIQQYGSSNYKITKLFTIRNNVVELLPIKDSKGILISGNLEKVDEITFKKTLYNHMDGTYNTDYYTWDGSQFILREFN
ncbi:hypothetical protein [Chengkuizengella marina]|uniref:Uncharacterized protein n=1 Tax=Chengkuizengella marina TaxID=2507566 RepID=A0A6N9Q513_9BACL|nr:hypothetical protein [Chengkuizengella marina]NBI29841.1 hypothetical protein [Chengkuizengella marina]